LRVILPAERGTGRRFIYIEREREREIQAIYINIYTERERDTGFGRNCGALANIYIHIHTYIHTYIGSGRNCVASAKTLVVSSATMKARWTLGATHLKAKQGF
jgi:hypothetical protein